MECLKCQSDNVAELFEGVAAMSNGDQLEGEVTREPNGYLDCTDYSIPLGVIKWDLKKKKMNCCYDCGNEWL